jgi:hypothetical protein
MNMKQIIGVNKPYGLVQRAGKHVTQKMKVTRRTKTMRKMKKTRKKH